MSSPGNISISITGKGLTIKDSVAVACGAEVLFSPDACADVQASCDFVRSILRLGQTVYGVNTGFGALSDVRIDAEEVAELQLNLVRSHASGVGSLLPEKTVRTMMLHRANVLAKGYSGCRPVVIETLVEMLNAGVHPLIPSRGSVGASGDLAPLAHLAIVLIGEGEAFLNSERLPGRIALQKTDIEPLKLEAKEGLALLNGTQAMTAVGGLALARAISLTKAADSIGAMTLEALKGTPTAFDEKIHAIRPHHGQVASARRLRELLSGSEIRESHRDVKDDSRVQDAYSLRCMPQVHGAVRDALEHTRNVLEIEINSATDNPLIFVAEKEILSGGNFHGAPVALALDYAAIAMASLGAISERRIERLVNPQLSGLPPFLTPQPGMNSGLMNAQVVAASLVAENNVLAHPASVFSLPTSANREDHVSMGMTAALKFEQIVEHVETILAIELLSAAQALEFLKPLKTSPKLMSIYDQVRVRVPMIEKDRPLSGLIESLIELVRMLT